MLSQTIALTLTHVNTKPQNSRIKVNKKKLYVY